MVNVSVLVGRITKDVQINKTSKGTSVANFTLAVQDRLDKERTDFIRCVAWGAQADFLGSYLGKGSLISVEGSIRTGSYEDRDGKTVFTTEVNVDRLQALESRAEREAREQNARPESIFGDHGYNQQPKQRTPKYNAPTDWPEPQYQKPKKEEPVLDITSDDLPF